MSHILIIDDEQAICWSLRKLLEGEGYSVEIAPSAEIASDSLKQRCPDLILLDVRLPKTSGLDFLKEFRDRGFNTPVIVMTAFGNLETAVSALHNGAFDYLTKPFEWEQARVLVKRALESVAHVKPASEIAESDLLPELLGKSSAMQEVFKRIALVAGNNTPVLISGECGTGKELVARAIHRHSARANQPLIAINLAAMNPLLIESELFGHTRGTSAELQPQQAGLLDLANSGTIFFDEVSDIPLSVQVKILRVIEHGEVQAVGDAQPHHLSLRFIAATNRDLSAMCAAGEFREDLYFRLAVFEIRLPPLRERREDIPLLAQKFLQKTVADSSASYFDTSATDEMNRRYWRGNVRELRNAVEHAALVARGGPIFAEHLPPPIELVGANEVPADSTTNLQNCVRQWFDANNASIQKGMLYEEFLPIVEAPLFSAVLEQTNRNQAAAAEWLGIHRATLRKRLGRIQDQD